MGHSNFPPPSGKPLTLSRVVDFSSAGVYDAPMSDLDDAIEAAEESGILLDPFDYWHRKLYDIFDDTLIMISHDQWWTLKIYGESGNNSTLVFKGETPGSVGLSELLADAADVMEDFVRSNEAELNQAL